MRLLLIRHARAAAANGRPDEARPLTDEGHHEFQLLAREIVDQGAAPEFIFHSPARRTTETASILAAAAGLPAQAQLVAAWLGLDTDWQQIFPRLAELTPDLIALVGHEPTMSSLATKLMGTGRLSFSPGTSACLEFDNSIEFGQGRLLWLLEPGDAAMSEHHKIDRSVGASADEMLRVKFHGVSVSRATAWPSMNTLADQMQTEETVGLTEFSRLCVEEFLTYAERQYEKHKAEAERLMAEADKAVDVFEWM